MYESNQNRKTGFVIIILKFHLDNKYLMKLDINFTLLPEANVSMDTMALSMKNPDCVL